jgi:hypothetical protein
MWHRMDFCQYVVQSRERIGILAGSDAIKTAIKKRKLSGERFTTHGNRVRVWYRYHFENEHAGQSKDFSKGAPELA